MTRRAASELGRWPNLVFNPQLGADFRLIVGGLPIHVENLVLWSQHLLGIVVAVQAPLHQQRTRLKYQWHLIDLPVARRATHSLVDVNAVIEVNEVCQAVHSDPFDGLIASIALSNRLKVGRVVEQH
jgi:hypothetical protein